LRKVLRKVFMFVYPVLRTPRRANPIEGSGLYFRLTRRPRVIFLGSLRPPLPG